MLYVIRSTSQVPFMPWGGIPESAWHCLLGDPQPHVVAPQLSPQQHCEETEGHLCAGWIPLPLQDVLKKTSLPLAR